MRQLNSKCKHEWVDIDDRTYNQVCSKCGLKRMQNAMALSNGVSASSRAAQPMLRETMEVPFYTGSKHVRITVDKETLLRELNRDIYPSLVQSIHR